MTLVRRDNQNQTYIDDSTGLLHLVTVANDGTVTNVVAYAGNGRLDGITEAAVTVDYDHHKIHDGDSYTCQVGQLVSDTNDRTAIAFKAPSTSKWVHIIAKGTASSPAWFYIREGATVADNQGATQAVLNRDRNSANTSGVIDTSQNPDATGAATYFAEADQAHVTENGTLLYQDLLAAEKKKGGGDTRGTSELVLEPNIQYVFYLKSLNNDNNYHGIVLDWYEHISLA